MNYDQMIAVLQAAKDGKAIQMRSKVNRRTGGAWYDVTDPLWDFAACNYRVKPEPRVFYAVLREHGGQCIACRDRELAETFSDPPDYKVVKLVEVLDDSAFFLFQFFVQPCTEHICWNAKHKSRDGKHDILGVNGVFGDSGDRDRRAIGAGSVIQSFDARHGDRLDADFGHVGAPGVCQNRKST